jgi:hypothetical protein
MNHLRQRLDVLFRDLHPCDDISIDGHGWLEHLQQGPSGAEATSSTRPRDHWEALDCWHPPFVPLPCHVIFLTLICVSGHVPLLLSLVEIIKIFLQKIAPDELNF